MFLAHENQKNRRNVIIIFTRLIQTIRNLAIYAEPFQYNSMENLVTFFFYIVKT